MTRLELEARFLGLCEAPGCPGGNDEFWLTDYGLRSRISEMELGLKSRGSAERERGENDG